QAFLSVTSILNVAVFKDPFVLEDLVEEMKKQSPALSFGPLQPDGHIAVQGSFPALQVLRDFLLLKVKSLLEKEEREGGGSQQRLRRRLQEPGVAEMRNSVRDAHGEKHAVVLDTNLYHYMRHLLPKAFQANGLVISEVIDGDITTVCVQNAGGKADAEHALRVKKIIEKYSIKLQKILRKETIHFKEQDGVEKQSYQRVCERLKPRYPGVLTIPYDTHIDVVGTSPDIFEFTEEVKR
ncbi:RBM43 protein, partial [Pardalotus punctatus]|nr:RBM43 protein [Pardalotus punctatus]